MYDKKVNNVRQNTTTNMHDKKVNNVRQTLQQTCMTRR